MAYSYVLYTGDGSQRQFDVTFPYLSYLHVSVTVNGNPVPFTWVSPTRVELETAPPQGAIVKIQRSSPFDVRLVSFTSNSLLKADDLNLADIQLLYLAQELADAITEPLNVTFLSLPDTPNTYEADKWVKVNATGTALEFTNPPVSGFGAFGTIPYWTTSQTLGYSGLYWDANNNFLGINDSLPECLVNIKALTPHNALKPTVGIVCDVPTGNHEFPYFPMLLTGTYKGTYTNQYETGWGGYVSKLVYGSSTDAATGTTLMLTTWETVYGEGDTENEHCAWLGAEVCAIGTGFPKTTGPVGRYWLADLNLHGPINVQPGALVGFNVFMNNYYNGQPAHGPSCAMWLHTEPGSGGWAEPPHYSATTYPIDVALGISGYSGTQANPNAYGFKTGIQIGGWGGGWKNYGSNNKFSKLEYGIRLLDYGVAAIHIGDRSFSGANAILVKNNGGAVGIWTETPADALHVAGGNVRISDGGRLVCPDMYDYTFAFFDADKKLQPAGMIYNYDGAVIVHPENYTSKADFDVRPTSGNSHCYMALSPKDGLTKLSVLKMYANNTSGVQEWVASIIAAWPGANQSDERLCFYVGHGTSGPEERILIAPESAGVTLFLPNSSGGIGVAYAWITYSDKKDKSDIRYVDESYLSKIQALKPAKYKFKGKLTDDIGFIAQDVQKVLPEAIVESSGFNGEPMLALNTNVVVTALVKAVQELATEVQNLKMASL